MHISQLVYNSLTLVKEQLEKGISNNFNSEISQKLDFIQKWLDDSKLTIAIPDQITQEWYRDVYLKSEHWLKKRTEALSHANWSCQLCNGKSLLNVHHRTYENLGCEDIKDVIVLCKFCHEKFHDSLPKMDKQNEQNT